MYGDFKKYNSLRYDRESWCTRNFGALSNKQFAVLRKGLRYGVQTTAWDENRPGPQQYSNIRNTVICHFLLSVI
jgi:hypothetical protein